MKDSVTAKSNITQYLVRSNKKTMIESNNAMKNLFRLYKKYTKYFTINFHTIITKLSIVFDLHQSMTDRIKLPYI